MRPDEARARPVEVVEGEGVFQGEAEVGVGDDFWGGGEGEEGGAALFGEGAEAVPGAGGDAGEFGEGVELEVEDDEGEIAVAEEEVGGFDGFAGLTAAHPEDLLAELGAGCVGIEAVAAIDEDDGALVGDGGVKEAADEEAAAAVGGAGGADDLGEGAAWDADLVEAGGASADGVARGARVPGWGSVGVRKLLAHAFAEL